MLILTEFLCILDFMLILVDVHYNYFKCHQFCHNKYSHPNISLKSQNFGDIKITSLTFNNFHTIIKQSLKFKKRNVY